MKVLVLGGSGMLGHKVWEVLGEQFETYATLRAPIAARGLDAANRGLVGVHADDIRTVAEAVTRVRPDVVVNCIGVVKQLAAAQAAIPSITINALFPHQVAEVTATASARMIQISTDCVFSGRRGSYREDDEPDPVDLYGRTKLLGETNYDHTMTIRTSIIGRELSGAHGLLEWFLEQTGTIPGYTRAIFSGLTTQALSETLARVIADYSHLSGTWHVAGERISKYDLLNGLASTYDHNVTIESDDSVVIDRSLDDAQFRAATRIPRPTWSEMLARLAHDSLPYGEMRAIAC
jgi:dTDP-4-dehydrorhamnose reductase